MKSPAENDALLKDSKAIHRTGVPLAILNDRGRDASQSFAHGIGRPGEGAHPPINYHAYAACLGGGFFRRWEEVPAGHPVLLLLRRDLRSAAKVVARLRERGHAVWVGFKEAGLHQVHRCLHDRTQWEALSRLAGMVHGALSSTPDLVPLYEAAGFPRVEFFPTPYPVGEEGWDFQQPRAERRGIFLGTREFDVPSRHHLLALRLALTVARRTGRKVTWIDNKSCPGWLRREFGRQPEDQEIIRGPLPYPDYLRLLARHEVVFQLDHSAVPGQVAGDCALARVLCVGGNGAVERVAFPETCGYGRDAHQLSVLLQTALEDPTQLARWEEVAHLRAVHTLSFSALAPRLLHFLQSSQHGGQ
jgi:hypothetical protein